VEGQGLLALSAWGPPSLTDILSQCADLIGRCNDVGVRVPVLLLTRAHYRLAAPALDGCRGLAIVLTGGGPLQRKLGRVADFT
jgi:hypothetical protein